ncbi:drug/metabolite transporter (DMT)-like permease [Prescottella agglutinans]|uniref:Drug/metabolite transporter (DMT)-like permease n=1 Tax=Prescottella agglutinans TaxID=1644129 RepID=A0ABT6MJP2_9NOCA|nr:drug/metabolite transporter (DMT)-like permease [Prescottella agglutinans]
MTVPFDGSGGFGTSPYVPPAAVQPLAGLKPPRSVWIGCVLLAVAGVLSIVNAALSMVTVNRVADMTGAVTEYDNSHVSAAYVDDVADNVSLFLVVVSIVAFACYMLLAVQIKSGRRWARTVCTVLAVVSLFGLLGPPMVWAVVVNGVAAVSALWLPASNAYFQAKQMARSSPPVAASVSMRGPGPDPTPFRF